MNDRDGAGSARATMRAGILLAALALAACGGPVDLDIRDTADGRLDTSAAAQGTALDRPRPDARGLITYPTYQVAVARRGDSVRSVAQRIGLGAEELARFNGIPVDAPLNADAVLALPRAAGGGRPDITAIAGAAIDRAGPTASVAPSGPEPVRHQVSRGETAFSIARLYGVSVRSLADWNGLGSDLSVREGQFLLIPPVVGGATESGAEVAGALGGASPVPPSAASALPEVVEAEPLPPSPNLDQFRTDAAPPPPAAPAPAATPEPPAPGASGLALRRPVSGEIRRGFSDGNEGLDFAAASGAAVSAAASGTVAAITRDTEQVPILVLRHPDGLLTVYANIADIQVPEGRQRHRRPAHRQRRGRVAPAFRAAPRAGRHRPGALPALIRAGGDFAAHPLPTVRARA